MFTYLKDLVCRSSVLNHSCYPRIRQPYKATAVLTGLERTEPGGLAARGVMSQDGHPLRLHPNASAFDLRWTSSAGSLHTAPLRIKTPGNQATEKGCITGKA